MASKPEREFVMPVGEESAAARFFTEAMRANTTVLEAVHASMRGMQAEQVEQRRLTGEVRERLIRIEERPTLERELGRIEGEVKDVKDRITVLERDKDTRDGAAGAWNWFLKHAPSIAAILVAIISAILLTLKFSGHEVGR